MSETLHVPLPFVPVSHAIRQEIVVLEDAFTREEVDHIESMLSMCQLEEARVGPSPEQGVYHDRRRSRIAWIAYEPDNELSVWLYSKLIRQVQRANLFLGLDVWGFAEPLQYAVYGPQGHYCWHKDSGIAHGEPARAPRKISFTLQLSDQSEYADGELQFLLDEKFTAPKKRGSMILFPSYTPHRVDFVTAGERRSLVGWVAGPDFV